jgi:tetratricopeptide (TPR) repeat protein
MPRLEEAEIERVKLKPTESLDAYDYYLRGVASLPGSGRQDTGERAAGTGQALSLFLKAIDIDPQFASAYGMAAQCYAIDHQYGLTTDRIKTRDEVSRLARRAAELGKDDATALTRAGTALGYVMGDVEGGAALLDRALLLNPNLALAWNFGGWSKIFLGQPELAIERMARAMRLNPLDPLLFLLQAGTALGYLFTGGIKRQRYGRIRRYGKGRILLSF